MTMKPPLSKHRRGNLKSKINNINKHYLKRKQFRKSIINRKPLEERYLKKLYQFSFKHAEIVTRMVRNDKYRQNFCNNQYSYEFEEYLESKEINRNIGVYLFPIERYMVEMKLDEMEILSDLAVDVFVGTREFMFRNYEKAGVLQSLTPINIAQMISQMLNAYTFPACENTVGSYHKVIESLIRKGIGEGKTQSELSREINDFMRFRGADNPRYVYDRIARNEVTRFMSESKVMFWEEVGVDTYEWIQGPGPCTDSDVCGEMADGSPYMVGSGPMPIQDTHINCLCDLVEFKIPSVVRDLV